VPPHSRQNAFTFVDDTYIRSDHEVVARPLAALA
jgi:hypothetical protein